MNKNVRMLGYLFLVLLLSACGVLAQTHDMSAMKATQPEMVDGSLHPELIADTLAFRMWMEHGAKTINDGRPRHMDAWFDRTGVGEIDKRQLIAIVQAFDAEEQPIIKTFNDYVTPLDQAGTAVPPAVVTKFYNDLAALTVKYRARVQTVLTQDGGAKFEAHVNNEFKREIKAPKGAI
jgi:hypothetical protein